MPNLVADDEREQATSLLATVEHIAWTVGPVLGRRAPRRLGAGRRVLGQRGHVRRSRRSSCARIPAGALRSDDPITRGHWADLRDGLGLVVHSRHLVTVLVVWSTAGVATAFVNVAEVVFAKDDLGAGNIGLGFLVARPASG